MPVLSLRNHYLSRFQPGTSAASCEPPQEPTDAFRSQQHPQRLVATAHPHRPCKWPWDTASPIEIPMKSLQVDETNILKKSTFLNFSTETPHSEMIRQESCPSGFKATIFQENMASQGHGALSIENIGQLRSQSLLQTSPWRSRSSTGSCSYHPQKHSRIGGLSASLQHLFIE